MAVFIIVVFVAVVVFVIIATTVLLFGAISNIPLFLYFLPISALISTSTDGTVRIFFYHLIPRRRPGFDPTSVSGVEPDWDLSDALPTEL